MGQLSGVNQKTDHLTLMSTDQEANHSYVLNTKLHERAAYTWEDKTVYALDEEIPKGFLIYTETTNSGKIGGGQLSDIQQFALESKGTWVHAAYHLTSATAGAPLLSLPFAMAAMGWCGGIMVLVLSAAVSYYACYCLSIAMARHLRFTGKRSLRFSDLSEHVIGSSWTYFLVAPLQLSLCFIVVIGGTLLGGQNMKEMYYTYNDVGSSFELYEFIAIFGVCVLLLGQIPSIHSLRHCNMASILLCFGFSLCATIGSIVAGSSAELPSGDYTIHGTEWQKLFRMFTALSVMVTAYSNPLVVEIQASLAEPAKEKMARGLGVCYLVALCTFVPVAISGYWAFGNAVDGVVFLSMFKPHTYAVVPRSLYFVGNLCACIQLIIYTVLHLHPTFERLEAMVADVKQSKFSVRNCLYRLLGRSVFVVLSTLLAAMLPFFVEFSAFMGAVGFTPISIFLPMLFYNIVCRPPADSVTFWLNCIIMAGAILVILIGGASSLHDIITDARTYRLFANI